MKKYVVLAPFGYERSPIFFKTLDYYEFSVKSLPLVELSISDDLGAFDACVKRLRSFDVVVFSSPTVVNYFFHRLKELAINPTKLDGCYLIAIGSATATALRQRGFSPDFVPRDFRSSSLVDALNRFNERWTILIPCSSKSLWRTETNLSKRYRVCTPVLYTNQAPDFGKRLDRDVVVNDVDVVAFTSPSAVENLSAMYNEANLAEVLRNKLVACIGPTTARACADKGIDVGIQPKKYTITAMMWSIIYHFGAMRS